MGLSERNGRSGVDTGRLIGPAPKHWLRNSLLSRKASRNKPVDRGGDQSGARGQWADLDLGHVFRQTGEDWRPLFRSPEKGSNRRVGLPRYFRPSRARHAQNSWKACLDHDPKSCGVLARVMQQIKLLETMSDRA
jgi:hypothetical protein